MASLLLGGLINDHWLHHGQLAISFLDVAAGEGLEELTTSLTLGWESKIL
jgi:hypothetical protein